MTTYVYRSDCASSPSAGWRYLWADTDGERETMVAIIGGAPIGPEEMSWVRHEITEDQLMLAIACGAELTDRWGPAYWAAQRRGDEKMIAIINETRRWSKPVA